MKVIKRNGKLEDFSLKKILTVISKAYKSCGKTINPKVETIVSEALATNIEGNIDIHVENIQDIIENAIMKCGDYDVARSFILYRESRKQARFIRERIDYMDKYSQSVDNAATSSETDANANVTMKNVANLEGEVYKTTNRIIQRQRMKDKLNEMFPDVAKQYLEDLNHHIIYAHNESTTPVLKQYCMAVSLYPLMAEGVGNIDGVTPSPPNDLQSFSGQLTNLIFLLSSQCKGAVAISEYFIALNYYIVKEYGKQWYAELTDITTTPVCKNLRTVEDNIYKAFKQFIYGVNQPAGNRGFQSPW